MDGKHENDISFGHDANHERAEFSGDHTNWDRHRRVHSVRYVDVVVACDRNACSIQLDLHQQHATQNAQHLIRAGYEPLTRSGTSAD